MIPTLSTLLLGFVIGYLGQRSRLCFVSCYRDLLLMRNASPLKGVFGAFLGALVGYFLFRRFGGDVPNFPIFRSDAALRINWLRIIVGGLGMGFIGAIIGGCPLRMHVLAAEGKRTYWFYLLGFYVALVLLEAVPIRHLIATGSFSSR
jgi:uncharacterized membrane protein YedE/YeeE